MLEAIDNFKLLSPSIATSGQPDAQELQLIAHAGYEVVINLGLSDTDYAIPDEREILLSQGLSYYHIPISFSEPEIEKFWQFLQVVKKHSKQKMFIHCAANKRVSVFMALYRHIEQNWNLDDALEEAETIWQPDDNWCLFIDAIIANHRTSSS